MAAGFDGIHIHGGNGYLISQFASPLTNRRADDWAEGGRFLAAVYDAVRAEVGAAVPVTARIGMADVPAGGLDLAASVARVQALQARGLDGVEPVYNIMQSYADNIRPYAGVRLGHALSQAALGAVGRPYVAEAYYRPFARALKAAAPGLPVILVGGLRSTAVMEEVLASGDADFLAMARPMVREPDLPRQIAAGRRGTVDCVSCNMCLMHEGKRALQCWRKTPSRMLRHAWLHYVADRRAPGN
jgi:2,4-dienoyl-CoA reductase-like NADH-dependent reductase (Old Yellow Enzyme family)